MKKKRYSGQIENNANNAAELQGKSHDRNANTWKCCVASFIPLNNFLMRKNNYLTND